MAATKVKDILWNFNLKLFLPLKYLLLCQYKTLISCEFCWSDVIFYGLCSGGSGVHGKFGLVGRVLKIYFIFWNDFPNSEKKTWKLIRSLVKQLKLHWWPTLILQYFCNKITNWLTFCWLVFHITFLWEAVLHYLYSVMYRL